MDENETITAEECRKLREMMQMLLQPQVMTRKEYNQIVSILISCVDRLERGGQQ